MMTSFPSSLRSLILAAWLLASLSLGACGFHPLYGSAQSAGVLSTVHINSIEDENGQNLRLMLLDSFYGHAQPITPSQWQLSVSLKTTKEDLGIRRDDIATRARLLLSGTFKLTPSDPQRAEKTKPFEGQVRTVVSYNILTDPYATTAAEDNALERGQKELATQLANRIALYLEGQHTP